MVNLTHLFYGLGIFFLFATVAYFSYEYIFDLSYTIKTIILVCLTIVFFFVADNLEERDV